MVWNDLADLPFAAALRIHRGDLAPAEAYEGAHFDQLDLCQPDAPGSRFLECAFTRVSIQEGQLRRARFTDVWLRDVTFDNCVLSDVDLSGATLTRTVFRHSRLTRTNFTRVTMDEVDLRGAELGITVDPTCLRGAIVTTAQLMDLAPLLAESMGLTVADG
jgi:uncharacterized protein YjbI with pentapeptide repeats